MNKRHEKILYMFSAALDAGDFATISDIWETALNDDELTAQLINLGLAIDEEDMQTIPLSNGKFQPVAPNVKPYAQRRQQTWVAAIFFMILMGGVLLFATLSTDDPVHTTIIHQGGTPTITPFYNPIRPTHSHTTHKPILENGKGVLSFQYPEFFIVTEDNEYGVQLWSDVFGTFIYITPPGDTRTLNSNLPPLAEDQSFASYVQSYIEILEARNTKDIKVDEYKLAGIPVVEISTSISNNAAIWFLDTKDGPLSVTTVGFNPYSHLSRDMVYEMLTSIQFDTEAFPSPINHGDIANNAVEINLAENPLLTTSFTAQERGLAYSFEGTQDQLMVISVAMAVDDDAIAGLHNGINIFLLDAHGQVIAELNGTANSERNLVEGVIALPEDGAYQLLLMPRGNESESVTSVGGSFMVQYELIQPLIHDDTQSDTLEIEDRIVSAWIVSVGANDHLTINLFTSEFARFYDLFVYPLSMLDDDNIVLPIRMFDEENIMFTSTFTTDGRLFEYKFTDTDEFIVIVKHKFNPVNADIYPIEYEIELQSEISENE